jgi:hypothetical protein
VVGAASRRYFHPKSDSVILLPPAYLGVVYGYSFAGQDPSESWDCDPAQLPLGIVLTNEGLLKGKPLKEGTFDFNSKVVDSTGSHLRSYRLQVNPPPVDMPVILTSVLPRGRGGSPLPGNIEGSGWQTALSVDQSGPECCCRRGFGSTPPPGMSLRPDGVLSGTPSRSGNFVINVSVTGGGARGENLQLRVDPAGLSIITDQRLPAATVGTLYSFNMSADRGKPPYSWGFASEACGRLQEGESCMLPLRFEGSLLSGVFQSSGRFLFSVTVSDTAGTSDTQDFTVEAKIK